MRKVARHFACAHLFEILEQRQLLSGSTLFDANPEAGNFPAAVYSSPAKRYRTAAVSGNAGAGETAQSYFDLWRRMAEPAPAPVVAVNAAADGWNASFTSAHLSVLATYAGPSGESSLTYNWSAVSIPAGASPVFTINGNHAARDTTVTFNRSGNYTFRVAISDGHTAVNSTVNVSVSAVLSSIVVTPGDVNLDLNTPQTFSATAFDQFGVALSAQPFTWAKESGIGAIDGAGSYTAGMAGTAIISASSSGVSGTATITVGNTAPTVQAVASVGASTPTSATLSVLGADDGGESGLTYSWSIVSQPLGASPLFSVNGNNASKSTVVTFNRAGSYSFLVTISDGSSAVTSAVDLDIAQTLTTIHISAGSSTVNLNQTTSLTAAALDQFGYALASPPTFAWSKFSGVGAVDAGGMFSSSSAGTTTLRAAVNGVFGSANVTVINASPTLATAAGASSTNVTGTTATLSALGADDGGEGALTYTWSATTVPGGATTAFTSNGANASKSTGVTFNKAGAYTFLVTISDGTFTATSSVSLTVSQTLASIVVSPGSAGLVLNAAQGFAATAYDQFGTALSSQPTFAWSKVSGVGSISAGGVFSSATAGAATIRAASAGISNTATVTVTNSAPTIATAAAANAGTVTGTTVTLSTLGADDGGESNLTYAWAATTQPAGALTTYSSNNLNASKSTVATFSKAGSYTFQVTVSDGTLTVNSSVTITVAQTLTTVSISPTSTSVPVGNTATFTAAGFDQFSQAIASPGTVSWTLDAGSVGSIDSSGLFTAGGSSGSATVRATIGGHGGTSAVTVTAASSPLTIASQTLTGFSDVVVHGTSGNDAITVSESGNLFTISNHGVAQTISGTFQDLVIYAGAGGSVITVNSSVTINVRVYGGAGADDIHINGTGGYNAIVSIGGGIDSLAGNGTSTYFWCDATDTVNATAGDLSANRVHAISSLYQPWSTDPNNADYVSTNLSGQNLKDPTDGGTTHQGTGWSLFGTGPQTVDIRQGSIGDCFLLASLGSLAYSGPARIYRSAVDLGDGTYAVRFYRNGVESVVRVDADLSNIESAASISGGIWVPIFEKAYAFFRTGANTYTSLNSGWMTAVLADLECTTSNLFALSSDSTLATNIQSALNAGQALSIGTGSSIFSSAPLIASHAYMVVGVFYDSAAATWNLQVRNPWGFDGTGSDVNQLDGIVTLSFAQLKANCSLIAVGW